MKIGPRYKIARRLGPDVFEKTQGPKFAARAAGRMDRKKKRPFSRSDFALQLREKQRARMIYGMGERQFGRYVKQAEAKKTVRDDEMLYQSLETRLDNVIFRLHLAPSRQASRQLVSHGHFAVNGVRVTIPSYGVKKGDVITINSRSKNKVPLQNIADKVRDYEPPAWLRFDLIKSEGTVVGLPKLIKSELPFNISAILEFYRR
ncbi:MAG: 30S ribosomal protein S4 [bacterium]|nr:30S ribosomal protein S4 [bacterium]